MNILKGFGAVGSFIFGLGFGGIMTLIGVLGTTGIINLENAIVNLILGIFILLVFCCAIPYFLMIRKNDGKTTSKVKKGLKSEFGLFNKEESPQEKDIKEHEVTTDEVFL